MRCILKGFYHASNGSAENWSCPITGSFTLIDSRFLILKNSYRLESRSRDSDFKNSYNPKYFSNISELLNCILLICVSLVHEVPILVNLSE